MKLMQGREDHFLQRELNLILTLFWSGRADCVSLCACFPKNILRVTLRLHIVKHGRLNAWAVFTDFSGPPNYNE